MRTEAYLSVDEPFHYTIGAIQENADDDDNRCLGTLQFATDKEKNQNSYTYRWQNLFINMKKIVTVGSIW